MPVKFGKKHGTGYHGNVDRRASFENHIKDKECSSPIIMIFKIKNRLIEKTCPDTCEFYERCLKKSKEVKK